jgi:Trk K+ transport system NAD-binding subunit
VLNPLVSKMLDPSESSIEMHEMDVNSKMKDKRIEEVSEKHNFTIISVFQEGKFLFPSDDFVLEDGMQIVVVKHNV